VGAAAAQTAAAPTPAPAPTRVLDKQTLADAEASNWTGLPSRLHVALDKHILAEAKNGSEIMANLGYLSDVIGPRLTGSAALKRANEWTAEKMKGYGLSNVHLEAYEIPAAWERGTATARILEPNNGRSLLLAAMGWTPGTNGKIEGDVVILQARTKEELAKYKGKLKNAIILSRPPATVRPITEPGGLPGQPFGRNRQGEKDGQFKKDGDGRKRDDAKKGEEARKGGEAPKGDTPGPNQGFNRGQFGEMRAFQRELAEFIRAEGAAAMLQDAGKPHGLLTTTGSWRGEDRANAPEPLPSLFVAHEHYALLYRLASRPAPARTRLELEVTNKLIPGPLAVYNTIGELPGKEKPDEYVIVCAHLDSWDLAQGTTDNGTGSSIVLEAARILAKCGVQPRRTIRFCLFSGEEQGLHGSRAYVRQHKDELPRISVALAHDTGTGKVTGVGLQGRASIKPILDPELAALKEIGFAEVNLRSMMGTDHQSFERVGVPGFALQQDMSEYRLTHHSQSDTFDKANEANLIQGAQVMAVMAMRVANLPSMLPRERN
jgi:hypothetical protein